MQYMTVRNSIYSMTSGRMQQQRLRHAGRATRQTMVCAAVVVIMAAVGCCYAADAIAGRLNVFVSILPQAYFVERIADSRADVTVLVGPGQSPHVFEPTPQQIVRLSAADIFFTIGLPFERRLLQKMSGIASGLACVATTTGITLRTPEGHDHEDDRHHHGLHDPHVWLAPALIKTQAERICAALCVRDPDGSEHYRRNLRTFHDELETLDRELREKLAPFAGREIFVFHPAFGYFTDAYGLRQVPIEIEGKEPGSRSLAAVIERARDRGVKVIFAERQFSPKTAQTIARQIGADVVLLDPLARDCFENLRFVADRIVDAFRKQ